MPDPNSLIDTFWPSPKAAIYAVAGFLLNMVWGAFRGRRSAVTWTAAFQQIKPTGLEASAIKIALLVNDKPAFNLQTCRITVTNDSSRDIENMDLLVTFYDPFVVVDDNAFLAASAKNLVRSDRFQQTVTSVAALPEAQRATHASFSYAIRNREYRLPALNRGETATFNFWIHSPSQADIPRVLVTSEKAGVKVISQPADIRWLDYSLMKRAALGGVFIALVFAVLVSSLNLSPLVMCLIAAIAGACAGIVGLFVARLLKWLRRVV